MSIRDGVTNPAIVDGVANPANVDGVDFAVVPGPDIALLNSGASWRVDGTSKTGNYTVSAGSNRMLFLATCDEASEEVFKSTVTYGGQALTRISHIYLSSAPGLTMDVWVLDEAGLAAASSTAFNVVGFASRSGMSLIAYQNVNQSALPTEVDTAFSTSTSSRNVDVTTEDGGMAFCAATSGASSPTFSWTGATERTDRLGNSHAHSTADDMTPTGGANNIVANASQTGRMVMTGIKANKA